MFQGSFNIKYWLSCLFLLVIAETGFSQCKADFSFIDNGNGNIQFYDSSYSNNKYYLKWHFGDGRTSAQYSPTHRYISPDTFTVCLVVKDSQNICTDSLCKKVIVQPKCASSFILKVDSLNTYKVILNNTSQTFGQMDYLWSFGDGRTSTKDTNSITYDAIGNYNISLEVSERNKVCKATTTQKVQIIDTSCKADFTFINSNNTYSKNFIDQSTSKDSFFYSWNFGDGKFSTASNPTHTYSQTGSFTTTLILNTGYKKCIDTISKTHWITGTCSASFNHKETQSGFIEFTNTSTHKTFIGTQGNLFWDFGNGKSNDSNKNVINHFYPKTGFYTTRLRLKNDANCIDSFEKEIAVGFVDTCKANFTFSVPNPTKPKRIQFNNLSRGFNTNSEWHFNDIKKSTEASPIYEFDSFGNYTVVLIITDTLNLCIDTFSLPLTIVEKPCKASFSYIQNEFGTDVLFTNTSKGDTLLSSWDFGTQGNSSSTSPSFEFLDTNSVLVRLIVTEKDSSCADTLNQLISIKAPKCEAQFSYTLNELTATFTNLSKAYKPNYVWDFDDNGATSTDTNALHIFSTPGKYDVRLLVNDLLGYCSDTILKQLDVQAIEKCEAKFTFQIDEANEKKVRFSSESQDVASHFWDFGDGNSSTAVDAQHTYKLPGSYNAMLVTSNNECRDTLIQKLDIATCNAYFNFGRNTADDYLVYIIDQSSGANRTYTWDFGDGSTSNKDQPFHDYDTFGTYLVCVSIKTATCSDSYCDTFSLDSNGNFSLKKAFRLEVFRDTFPPAAVSEFGGELSLFPNPVYDYIQIENLNEAPLSIVGVFSTTGQKMNLEMLDLGQQKAQINFQNIPPGLYTIYIKVGDQYVTKRVIKQ